MQTYSSRSSSNLSSVLDLLLSSLESALYIHGLGTAGDFVEDCTQHLEIPPFLFLPHFLEFSSHFPVSFYQLSFLVLQVRKVEDLLQEFQMPCIAQSKIFLRLKTFKTGNTSVPFLFFKYQPLSGVCLLLVSLPSTPDSIITICGRICSLEAYLDIVKAESPLVI